MSTDYTSPTPTARTELPDPARYEPRPPHTSETKPATRTTELIAYLTAVVGLLVAVCWWPPRSSETTRATPTSSAPTAYGFYIVLLTIGYMLSRGLAKSGSHEHRDV